MHSTATVKKQQQQLKLLNIGPAAFTLYAEAEHEHLLYVFEDNELFIFAFLNTHNIGPVYTTTFFGEILRNLGKKLKKNKNCHHINGKNTIF